MIHPVDERLRQEARRFRLVFTCGDCAQYDRKVGSDLVQISSKYKGRETKDPIRLPGARRQATTPKSPWSWESRSRSAPCLTTPLPWRG